MDAPRHNSIQPGAMLAGKYRVEGILGEGGMGVVLSAVNVALNQRVAIKLLRGNEVARTEVVGRFVREARAAARLRSEHVARMLDVGSLDDGRPFMVMEHLEGRDLGAIVREGPLPLGVAVDYLMQACEAIVEAHAAGIIHRDLKPQNLFLTHAVDGRPIVKVLDFGISKMADQDDLKLTGTQDIFGSPSYMSPEQLRSARDVDTRTDVWSLGVILYELLTADVPFHAGNITELIAAVLTDVVKPIHAMRGDVPEAIDAILARCLAKRRDDRFGTVVDLVTALEPYGSHTNASFSDRIRSVAASSGRLPDMPITGRQNAPNTGPPAFAMSSQRVPVHGESTQLQSNAPPMPAMTPSGPPPPAVPAPQPSRPSAPARIGGDATGLQWGTTGSLRPKPNRTGLVAALAGAFSLVVVLGLGGVVWWRLRSTTTTNVTNVRIEGAGASSGISPLPEGRKDLPPIASETAAKPVETPPAASSQKLPPSTTSKVEPRGTATASKTPAQKASATASAPTPTPPPVTTSSDPLSGIGRR